MSELAIPVRRFALVRRILRQSMPCLYGWMLGNATLRRFFSVIKVRRKIITGDDLGEKFTAIYESHYWEDDESRSGAGSNLYATKKIRQAIPGLFAKYGIRSVVDIPCGDFFWFKEMSLDIDSYLGGDIVAPLIKSVSEKYASPIRSFRVMDLTKDVLPECDLILVRDCFIHLSFEAIFGCLKNIVQTKSGYLLTTTFSNMTTNVDIGLGNYHTINLCSSPFAFPPPLELIDDYAKGMVPRQLGLWRIDDLRRAGPLREVSLKQPLGSRDSR